MPRSALTQAREAKFKKVDHLAQIRALRERHPVLDAAAGFIPGVGIAQGVDDLTNPEVGLGGKLMAGAGMIPGAALIKALRGAGKAPSGIMSQMAPAKPRLDETMEIKLPEPEGFKVDPALEQTQEIHLGKDLLTPTTPPVTAQQVLEELRRRGK